MCLRRRVEPGKGFGSKWFGVAPACRFGRMACRLCCCLFCVAAPARVRSGGSYQGTHDPVPYKEAK